MVNILSKFKIRYNFELLVIACNLSESDININKSMHFQNIANLQINSSFNSTCRLDIL